MIGLLRNPEIRRELLLYIALSLVFCAFGFLIGTSCGVLIVCACLLFTVVHVASAYMRYRRIRELSQSIDRILHDSSAAQISRYDEGELAILQNEIQKMTTRLRESADSLQKDKLRLTDSIADISHQLRTPLTSINLIVSILSSAELDDERRLQLTRELKKLLARIDWLVEALLKISRIDTGTVLFKKEAVSVSELLSRAAEPLAVPLDVRGQTLTLDAGEEQFMGDMGWSVEAVGNILKNCMEHTPDGGRIEAAAVETALYTEITVRDTGSGIDREDLQHIFERFYKGKNASEGSFGIGLALCRMIVTAQNGTVKAENYPGGGAVFTLRFYKSII